MKHTRWKISQYYKKLSNNNCIKAIRDCRRKIYIDLDGLVLNGIDYSEGDYLEIYPIDDIIGVHIWCDGKIERAYLTKLSAYICSMIY